MSTLRTARAVRSRLIPFVSSLLAALLPALLLLAPAHAAPGPSQDDMHDHGGAATAVADDQPLGTVRLQSSCEPAAQVHLERGLALLHHMTYEHAEAEFAKAGAADPECALAWWGVAMTYVHPVWPDTVPADRLAEGRALLEKAAEAEHTSPREAGYVRALAAYYEGDDTPELERLARFRDGWAAVHEAHPGDPEAKVLLALATLSLALPSDKELTGHREAGRIAEEVLKEIPDHPGAHHYIIHAYDVPALAERALPVAQSYGSVAPENPHALHMTSHIFTRRGLWDESIEFNTRSAKAAEGRTAGGAVSMHHLHALDYLAYAYLQKGEEEAARRVHQALRELEPPFQDHAGTAYAFAAIPARLALERHAWEEATEVPVRWPDDIAWDRYPHLEAIPVFARGLGAAFTGDEAGARAAIEKLGELRERAESVGQAYDWATQVEIQRQGVEAWHAFHAGDRERGLELMRSAAELEATTEKNPVTPGEVLPASELYGDMLRAAGRTEEARRQYEAALERSPNRRNSVRGAEVAAEAPASGAGERE